MANTGKSLTSRRRVFGCAIAILVIAGCTSTPSVDDRVPTQPELARKQVQAFMDEENLSLAAVSLGRVYRQELLPAEDLKQLMNRLSSAHQEAFEAAIQNREYQRAAVLRRNLHHIHRVAGLEPAPELNYSEERLVTLHIRELLEQERWVPALNEFRRRKDLLKDETELLHDLQTVARDTNNAGALRDIRLLLGEPEEPRQRVETSDMLAGVVTVWVNRGIAIRDGVGVPDRVVGSGFFVDPRGYVLTNYHVISSEVDPEYEGYSRLFIKLSGDDDRRVPARVVGYDRIFDLALLKVEVEPEYVFSIGTRRSMEPGDPVLALGSPGGLKSSVTAGIVSSASRRFLQLGEAIQVDAAINPGNSGGPLILPDGEVAGVVFAGIEQFEGVNFAVPAYWVHKVLDGLFTEDEAVHSWIGAAARRVEGQLEIVYVMPNSPAELSGLQTGDRVKAVDGTSVGSLPEIHDILLDLPLGQLLQLKVNREGESRDVTVATAERPYSPAEAALDLQPIEQLFPVLYGMNVRPISKAPWGPDYVVDRVYPGGIADESNLSESDPFALRNWYVDQDLRAAFIQIVIKRRKAGFIESGVQLGSFLESNLFF